LDITEQQLQIWTPRDRKNDTTEIVISRAAFKKSAPSIKPLGRTVSGISDAKIMVDPLRVT
jgi:hypothetical protein